MRRSVIAALALGLGLVLPVQAQTVTKDPSRAPNGSYTVDFEHTQVLFSILHLGLTDFFGRFDKISGTLAYDGKEPERSSLSITIDTTSIDTPLDRLTDDLKGGSVFDTAQFPTATFISSSVARTGPDTGRIAGLLTIRNQTKPVTLDVTFNGSESSPLAGGYALGFHATTTIRRSDFGLNRTIWSPFVGDEVRLTIEAMFDRKKD
jgi:polyisoprenoid-binding protein YceI